MIETERAWIKGYLGTQGDNKEQEANMCQRTPQCPTDSAADCSDNPSTNYTLLPATVTTVLRTPSSANCPHSRKELFIFCMLPVPLALNPWLAGTGWLCWESEPALTGSAVRSELWCPPRLSRKGFTSIEGSKRTAERQKGTKASSTAKGTRHF